MTQKRDLKRRVRERQVRTGESYMTALRHVRGEHAEAAPAGDPPALTTHTPSAGAIPVVELVDVSDIAGALGLTCRAMVMPVLIERVDPRAMLTQLRGVLQTTAGDPAFALLRGVVLLGERPSFEPETSRTRVRSALVPDDTLQFAARVRAGVGGVSSDGRTLAFSVTGRGSDELVVFNLWPVPVRYNPQPPALLITIPNQFAINIRFGLGVDP